jgi:hypothetical protein
MMNIYSCPVCTLRYYNPVVLSPANNLTGSAYLLGKFLKHTPGNYNPADGVVSKYHFQDYPTYCYLLHQAIQSGSLEVDSQNRRNLLLPLRAPVGQVYDPSGIIQPVDVVKVVKPHDLKHIHHYATGSFSLIGARCWSCGNSII